MVTLLAMTSKSQSQFQYMQATQADMATNMKSMQSDMALHGSRLKLDMAAQATAIQQNHAEAKTTISSVIEILSNLLDEVAKITKADLATAADRVSQVDDALRLHTVRVNAVAVQLETVLPLVVTENNQRHRCLAKEKLDPRVRRQETQKPHL